MLLVTNSLQFINLPCIVFQSSYKVEPRVVKTETALREFPCKTIGGPIGILNKSKLKQVSNIVQNNQIKSFESRLHFFHSHSLLNSDGKVQ